MAHVITVTDQNTIRRRGTGLRLSDPTKAFPGYTLFAPLTGAGEVYLIDLAGNVAHAWQLPYPPGLHGYLLPNGHLFYGAKTPDVPDPVRPPGWDLFKGGAIFEVDWAGNRVWEFRHADHHHDAVRLRNGNTLITEGAFGRLCEVTPEGQTVWEYVNPHFGLFPPPWRAASSAFTGEHNAVFRAFRYAAADLPALR
jgi:hypothetical protein